MTSTQSNQVYFNAKQLKLPLSLDILIPFDSEARTFDEVFRRIDLGKYLVRDSQIGRIPYNPVNMLKLILFCHMEKIKTLREMEKAARNDIRLMWLTDETKPTHETIKRFIDERLSKSIEEIFKTMNEYIIESEQIDRERLYIDGTKIEANANKYTFIWKGSIEKFQMKLQKSITKVLDRMNRRYEEQCLYFERFEYYEVEYLERIKNFLEIEIDREGLKFVSGKGTRKKALQRDYEDISGYLEKLRGYIKYLDIIGPDRNSCARTDHAATFMHMKEDHMRNGQLKPGYNVQIGVADEFILHVDIFQERNDYKTFIPFMEGFKKAYGYQPKYPVADAGYGGLSNYRYLKENKMELYQKYNMYEKDTSDKKRIKDPKIAMNLKKDESGNYIWPEGGTLQYLWRNNKGNDVYQLPNSDKRMEINEELLNYQNEVRINLKSELGIELRVERSIQVEGAFAVIKEAFKMRRFRRRGTENVKLEFILLAIGYNLAKLHSKKYRITQ
jgi:transposase